MAGNLCSAICVVRGESSFLPRTRQSVELLGGYAASGLQDETGQLHSPRFDVLLPHQGKRFVDVVGDLAEMDFAILNDRVRSSRIAVAGLADAAGVDNTEAACLQFERDMRVADAEEIGFDPLHSRFPTGDISRQVLVHRIARGRMEQLEPIPIELHTGSNRQPGEELIPGRIDQVPVQWPRGNGELAEPAAPLGQDSLGHGVIVIPAHRGLDILPHPIDARNRIGTIVDEVAEEQTGIERLLNRAQGGPVRVDVGK